MSRRFNGPPQYDEDGVPVDTGIKDPGASGHSAGYAAHTYVRTKAKPEPEPERKPIDWNQVVGLIFWSPLILLVAAFVVVMGWEFISFVWQGTMSDGCFGRNCHGSY